MENNECNICSGKPFDKVPCGAKDFTKSVIEINNPEHLVLFRKVVVPASLGDDTTVPPTIGKYYNVLLNYEANNKSYLYSSDGIPTLMNNGVTDYEEATNLPQINGVTLLGNKTSEDLHITGSSLKIDIDWTTQTWSGADSVEDIYDYFVNKGKVVFSDSADDGGEYGYDIIFMGYIPDEHKILGVVQFGNVVNDGEGHQEFDGTFAYGTIELYNQDRGVYASSMEVQKALSVVPNTGLNFNYSDTLSGAPATGNTIGMVKPGAGLSVDSNGTLSIDGTIIAFDTVADMKLSEDLSDGVFVETYGFYDKGDGGGSKYKVREVTNLDTVDEMYLIALADEDLVAELIIDANTTIVNFGAKSDRSEDIAPYWAIMLAKCGIVRIPKGRFLLQTPIEITSAYDIKCDGNIYYDGNAYAFIVNNTSSSFYNIYRFDSPNGGMFNISSTNTVTFLTIDVHFSWCSKHVVYMNANNGIITMTSLNGVRWSSTATPVIELYQDTSTIASAYISETEINNIDFVSTYPAVKATCTHATKSTNVNMYNVNLESSAGIHCYDRVFYLGLYNVRLDEISQKLGWLTFNNYMPIVNIDSVGTIDPANIVFNNVPDYGTTKYINTNTGIKDHVTNDIYMGGGIITSRYVKPNEQKFVWKGLTSDIEDDAVTLPEPNTTGNLYRYFTFIYANDLTINIPTNFRSDFYLATTSAVNVTIQKGNLSCTIPSTEVTTGLIRVTNIPGVTVSYEIIKHN